MSLSTIVYIKFPKTGLGNMLLVWAKGMVFARLNNLNYTTSQWRGFHWGALIRGERRKRFYFGYFNETPLWKQFALNLKCKLVEVIREPPVEKITGLTAANKKIYLFNKVITDPDLFGPIRKHQAMVKEELGKLLTIKMQIKMAGYQVPVIGVHIRRGDFKLGNQTTPLYFFIEAIHLIRTTIGENVPVTVFTDAHEQELTALLAIPNISIAEDKPDILDILLLSKSKILILSRSSTFGYWAAFLSNAIVIRPLDDWQQLIKPNDQCGIYTEVKWQHGDAGSTSELINKIGVLQL